MLPQAFPQVVEHDGESRPLMYLYRGCHLGKDRVSVMCKQAKSLQFLNATNRMHITSKLTPKLYTRYREILFLSILGQRHICEKFPKNVGTGGEAGIRGVISIFSMAG